MTMNRRDVLSAAAVGVPALTMAAAGENKASAAPKADKDGGGAAPAFAGKHVPLPLPFAPGKLTGISEKMIVSHHDNNYTGAIKNLNKVEEQLAAVNKETPGFLVAGLKERELTFTNSMILHEQYFGNLGGNGKVGGAIQQKLAASYGSQMGGALSRRRAQPRRRKRLGRRGLQPSERGGAHLLGREPHPDAGGRTAAAGDGHVRARLRHRLRRGRREVHRRVLPEHQLGRRERAPGVRREGGRLVSPLTRTVRRAQMGTAVWPSSTRRTPASRTFYGAPSTRTSVGVSPTFTLTAWLLTAAGVAVPLADPAVNATVVADEIAAGKASA